MAKKIAESYHVEMIEVLTGFKFIGEKIKLFEEDHSKTFLFGFEESYGYLKGTYARDKDAVVASMLIAEAASSYYLKGMSLYDAMEALYQKYGYYEETVVSVSMKGLDGHSKMSAMMADLRLPVSKFSRSAIINQENAQTFPLLKSPILIFLPPTFSILTYVMVLLSLFVHREPNQK